MKKKSELLPTMFGFAVVALTAATPVLAQDLEGGINNLANTAKRIIIGVITIVAAIYWALVAKKFLAGEHDAKQALTNAILGTVLLAAGGGIVTFIMSQFGR